MSRHRNNLVIIDIWANWCGACYWDLPFLKEIEQKYKTDSLEVIAISIDKNEKAWKKGLQHYNSYYRHTNHYLIPNGNPGTNRIIQYLQTRREQERITVPVPKYILLDKRGRNVITNLL